MLILSLIEEVGEMARAYLAKHGRKKTNMAAQQDETYRQELGDILVAIIRFAKIKDIDLNQRIMYSLRKIEGRKKKPKRQPSLTLYTKFNKQLLGRSNKFLLFLRICMLECSITMLSCFICFFLSI
jgi:NTP pyrophosphatase (non-canonical NTP hydrolase)